MSKRKTLELYYVQVAGSIAVVRATDPEDARQRVGEIFTAAVLADIEVSHFPDDGRPGVLLISAVPASYSIVHTGIPS